MQKKIESKENEMMEVLLKDNIRWLQRIEKGEWDMSYIPKIIKRNQYHLKKIEKGEWKKW